MPLSAIWVVDEQAAMFTLDCRSVKYRSPVRKLREARFNLFEDQLLNESEITVFAVRWRQVDAPASSQRARSVLSDRSNPLGALRLGPRDVAFRALSKRSIETEFSIGSFIPLTVDWL